MTCLGQRNNMCSKVKSKHLCVKAKKKLKVVVVVGGLSWFYLTTMFLKILQLIFFSQHMKFWLHVSPLASHSCCCCPASSSGSSSFLTLQIFCIINCLVCRAGSQGIKWTSRLALLLTTQHIVVCVLRIPPPPSTPFNLKRGPGKGKNASQPWRQLLAKFNLIQASRYFELCAQLAS